MRLLWHMPTLRSVSCGLSNRALQFAGRLQKRGHDVRFAVARDKTDCETGEIAGIPVQLLDVSRRTPIHWSLQALERQRSANEAVSQLAAPFDVFISCQPEAVSAYRRHLRAITIAADADRMAGIVFVCGGTTLLHDRADRARMMAESGALSRLKALPAFALDRALKHRNERRAFHSADVCILDSKTTTERVVSAYGIDSAKCHAVRGAVDTKQFRPATHLERRTARGGLNIADDEFVLAWTGRLSPEKNLDTLLKAVPLCTHQRVRLLLAGDGPERARLEKIAESNEAESRDDSCSAGAAPRVQFLRDMPDVRLLLHAADGFVFPSVSESLGLSLVEAIACGLPSMALGGGDASASNASAEILEEGRCGRLIIDNTPASFARAIDQFVDDGDARAVFAAAGRQRAESVFDWSNTIDLFESLVTQTTCRSIGTPPTNSARGVVGRKEPDRLARSTQDSRRIGREQTVAE